ncbi:MAG TPA: hypothetical protein VNX00_11090, partial [Herbaspirillum sp.]|nr:hypothetical protein [Herbaspirillum sp.]
MSQVKNLHDRIAATVGLLASKGPNVALAAIQEALKNGPLADVRTSNAASSFRSDAAVMGMPQFPVGQPEFVSKLLKQLGVCVPGMSDAPATPVMPSGLNAAGTSVARTIYDPAASHASSEAAKEDAIPGKGQFLSKSYANQAGSRRYKVYIPSTYVGQPMPLMVMLHGCT